MIHAFTGRYGNADEATVRKLHGEGERAALPAVFLANIYRTYTWKSEVPPISSIGACASAAPRPPAWLQAEFVEVRSAVRPSAVSVGIADRILAHIAINFGEPVLTLHLRRGDFGAVCDGALTICSVCLKSAFQRRRSAMPPSDTGADASFRTGTHGESHPDIYLSMRQVGGPDCYPTLSEISDFVHKVVEQVGLSRAIAQYTIATNRPV